MEVVPYWGFVPSIFQTITLPQAVVLKHGPSFPTVHGRAVVVPTPRAQPGLKRGWLPWRNPALLRLKLLRTAALVIRIPSSIFFGETVSFALLKGGAGRSTDPSGCASTVAR